MGLSGLWVELRAQGACSNLSGQQVESLLEGCTVAVDAAIWLHEVQYQRDLVRIFGQDGVAVKVFYERCTRFLRKGILPVIVLEGRGGGRAAREFGSARLSNVFAPHAKLRALLSAMGVPYVDADGEAEATCAALAAYGHCEFAVSSDSDVLLFSRSCGQCRRPNKSKSFAKASYSALV